MAYYVPLSRILCVREFGKRLGLVLWHINLRRLFNAKPIFIHTNSSISNNSV